MANAALLAAIRALRQTAARTAARNVASDAEQTVPKVYRPTDEIPLDVEEAESFFGPSRSELDREPLVLEEFQRRHEGVKTKKGKTATRGSAGSIEQELNDIERELIDAGELEDIGATPYARSDWDPKTPRKRKLGKGRSLTALSPEEAKQVETFIDPKLPPEATHFRELENFERFLRGEEIASESKAISKSLKTATSTSRRALHKKLAQLAEEKEGVREVPITRGQRPGRAKGAGERIETKKRSDDIDVLNERRAARLADFTRQLREARKTDPEIDTPANRAILAEDVIQADIADKAAGNVFGLDKANFPKNIDPESRLTEFSLRELEDIFGKNDLTTPQGRAVARLRKEASQAAKASGRPPVKLEARQLIPRTAKGFARRERPDPSKLEPVQEKLTGPLRPEVALKLSKEAEAKNLQQQKLLLERQLRDEPGEIPQADVLLEAIKSILDKPKPPGQAVRASIQPKPKFAKGQKQKKPRPAFGLGSRGVRPPDGNKPINTPLQQQLIDMLSGIDEGPPPFDPRNLSGPPGIEVIRSPENMLLMVLQQILEGK